MKLIMISIQPQHTMNILNLIKKLEIRKTCPSEWKDYLSGKTKIKPDSMKCVIYCTKGNKKNKTLWKAWNYYYCDDRSHNAFDKVLNGKVVASFTLNKVDVIECDSEQHKKYCKDSCLTQDDFISNCNGQDLYAWHIDDLKIYDTPKEIIKFRSTSFCFNMANIEIVKNCFGDYVDKCYENSFCKICKHIDDFGTCGKRGKILTRPPQSWCYVEELVVEND